MGDWLVGSGGWEGWGLVHFGGQREGGRQWWWWEIEGVGAARLCCSVEAGQMDVQRCTVVDDNSGWGVGLLGEGGGAPDRQK